MRRHPSPIAVLLSLLLGASLGSGCIDIDFDPPSIVITKRILAMSAEPPEAFPGEDITFEVLATDENGEDLFETPGVTAQWTVCISLASVFGAAGLGSSVELSDTCGEGGPDLVVLETEGLAPGQARLDGDVVIALAAAIMEMGMGGGELPPGVTQEQIQTLLTVISIVGVPFRPVVEIYQDGELVLRGRKRFAITTRDMPTTNPPPPRFAIDGTFVSARPPTSDDPRACVSEGGAITLPVATEITLSPADDDEDWPEEYPVYNLSGELQTNEESAFYSWYATAGDFSREETQLGDHDTVWTTPEEPGEHYLWVVVRDGHLGTTWCRTPVTVSN